MLNMHDTAFDRVHCVGMINNQRPRDIVAELSSFPDRDAAFRNHRKLMGTNFYVNENLCPSTLEVCRRQLDALREARRDGKEAFFNYLTLVIREPLISGSEDGGRRNTHVHRHPTPSPAHRTLPTSPAPTTVHQPPFIHPTRAIDRLPPLSHRQTGSDRPRVLAGSDPRVIGESGTVRKSRTSGLAWPELATMPKETT